MSTLRAKLILELHRTTDPKVRAVLTDKIRALTLYLTDPAHQNETQQ